MAIAGARSLPLPPTPSYFSPEGGRASSWVVTSPQRQGMWEFYFHHLRPCTEKNIYNDILGRAWGDSSGAWGGSSWVKLSTVEKCLKQPGPPRVSTAAVPEAHTHRARGVSSPLWRGRSTAAARFAVLK